MRSAFRIVLWVFWATIMSFVSAGCSRLGTTSMDPISASNSNARIIEQSAWSWRSFSNEPKSYDKVRAVLENLLDSKEMYGLSVSLKQGTSWSNQPKTYSIDIGVENPDSQKRIDASSAFPGGNLSEPVVAYMTLKLASQGKIDIDRPLVSYLVKSSMIDPDWKTLLDDPRSQRLTARRILSHQCGLPFSRRVDPNGRLRFIDSPGRSYQYSMEAYPLLYPILEQISGQGFGELTKRLVFDPIGMPLSRLGRKSGMGGDAVVEAPSEPDNRYPFFTTTTDFTKFAWLTTINGLDLSSEYAMAYFGSPETSVRTSSISEIKSPDKAAILPKGLSWFLGWGRYELPYVILGNCRFIGEKGRNHEAYAMSYGSRNSTVLTIFLFGMEEDP